MRLYAVRVAVAANGDSVCHCGAPVSLFDGDVDRTDAGCYRPGFVVMTCRACNNDRTYANGFDNVAYEADILAASLKVNVPTKAEAKAEWDKGPKRGESLKKSKYIR